MRSPLSLTAATCAALLVLLSPDTVEALQKVLVYTGIGPDGYSHPSIPTARQAIKHWGQQKDAFDSILVDDSSKFEKRDWLMQFDAVVFVSTAGTALTPRGVKQFRRYIKAGGGFMGVHEATDCLYNVPWYRTLIGTTFNYHPQRQQFTVDVHHHSHPSVKHLSKKWIITDEIYNFNIDPRKFGNTVVLSADESTYDDGVETKEQRASEQGDPHPLAWYREGNLLTGSEEHHDHDDDDDDGNSRHKRSPAVANSTRSVSPRRRHHHHGHKRSLVSNHHGHSIMELARRADDNEDEDGGDDPNDDGTSVRGNDAVPDSTINYAESTGPGRSFYTGLGHGDNMWNDDDFMQHVGGAIQWLLASPSISSNAENDELPGSAYLGPPVADGSGSGSDGSGYGSGSGSGVGPGFTGSVGFNGSAAAASNNQLGGGASAALASPSFLGSLGAATLALFAGSSFFGL
ncbi:hypothetical protein A4X13_0g6871 [Tilletia indica]|uniref:ThuA-like domain-containing protein n=1 Tax=Tilletia indica TaxID=43049 RepID=A0A177TSV2_9BASI|nr:hypothetical protein A4X13_0g6871 [Tilletia indica]